MLLPADQTDRSLFTAEQTFASAKEERDFYMASLQALTLFKSKSERALLDMQSRAEGAQREAAEARQRYESVRTSFLFLFPLSVFAPTVYIAEKHCQHYVTYASIAVH